MLHIITVFPTGKRKDRLTTGILAGLNVRFRITDKISAPRIGRSPVDRFQRLDDIADARLAAIASIRRLACAIQHIRHPRPGSFDPLKHMRGDQLKLAQTVNTLAHTRLIGNNKNMIPGVRQEFKRIKHTRDEMKILHLGHIKTIARELIDHTVSV